MVFSPVCLRLICFFLTNSSFSLGKNIFQITVTWKCFFQPWKVSNLRCYNFNFVWLRLELAIVTDSEWISLTKEFFLVVSWPMATLKQIIHFWKWSMIFRMLIISFIAGELQDTLSLRVAQGTSLTFKNRWFLHSLPQRGRNWTKNDGVHWRCPAKDRQRNQRIAREA